MAENNHAMDSTSGNPPGIVSDDFDETRFSDIELDDLFWLKNGGDDNPPFRKLNETEAANTWTRLYFQFNSNDVVYQRT